MQSPEQPRNDLSLLKINTALRDFARLVRTVNGVSSSSQEMLDTTAMRLLLRLLTLCDATQGTLLLTMQPHEDWQENTPALTNPHQFPIAVYHHMSKATVLTSLQQFSPTGPEMQWLADTTSTKDASDASDAPNTMLVWQRSFADYPLLTQPPDIFNGKAPKTLPTPLQPACQAFFLLQWQAPTQHATQEQRETMLALVADAIDAILVNIWLSLCLCDLEQRTRQKEQEHIELLKAELLATVSHELRSPLASIKGYTATLLRHDHHIDQEERHEFLQAIKEGSLRLEHIVDRLLELSQLETQKISFSPVPLNLPALVQEAITATKQFHRAKPMHPSILFLQNNSLSAQTNESLLVNGDRRLLRTMLDHLFENAQLYSPPTSPIEVGISLIENHQWLPPLANQPLDQAQRAILLYPPPNAGLGLLELWIKDHGIGIAPEHLQPIFERFYRVDTRLTREINGLGVGLAICKGIVELHRGGLWVESTIGAGSTFHILLPQATATMLS